MKKVLVIAYFYPPCNLTASQRPASWTKYLHEFGYYPIVLTRNWEQPINKPADISKPSGEKEVTEENENSKVIYLPYKGTLKDKLYTKYGDSKFRLVRRALSFFELVFQNFFFSVIPFSNIYCKAEEIIASNKSIDKIVITANPFVSFFIGYKLKKKFPYLKWIADYRDDWSTTELGGERNFLQQIIFKLESASERKWVSTASLVTTISDYYLSKISSFVNRDGKVLLNGFSEEDFNKVIPLEKQDELVITYNGTLYSTQAIEIFLEGFKKVVEQYGTKLKFKLNFPGLAFDKTQAERVRSAMKGYEYLLNITERIPREKVFELQNESHAFLMVSHTGIKGIPSSKLYEYLCFRKPIIVCPNDKDIIRDTVNDAELGIVCDSTQEVFEKLSALVDNYIANGKIPVSGNAEKIMNYSRRNQTKVLAEILDSL